MGLGPIFVGIRAFESHPSHSFHRRLLSTIHAGFFATFIGQRNITHESFSVTGDLLLKYIIKYLFI